MNGSAPAPVAASGPSTGATVEGGSSKKGAGMVYFGNVSTALGSAGLSWTYNWEFALAPVSELQCKKHDRAASACLQPLCNPVGERTVAAQCVRKGRPVVAPCLVCDQKDVRYHNALCPLGIYLLDPIVWCAGQQPATWHAIRANDMEGKRCNPC